jgi:hypothetical protein
MTPADDMLHIDTPLPENVKPGDPVPWADPQWLDLLTRKVNALYAIQGAPGGNIQVHKSEGGFVIEQLS